MTERRVWRVPTGQVQQNITAASQNNCSEIQEVAGLGQAALFVETVPDPEPSLEERLAEVETRLDALEVGPR